VVAAVIAAVVAAVTAVAVAVAALSIVAVTVVVVGRLRKVVDMQAVGLAVLARMDGVLQVAKVVAVASLTRLLIQREEGSVQRLGTLTGKTPLAAQFKTGQ
jgi:hypothetical protein